MYIRVEDPTRAEGKYKEYRLRYRKRFIVSSTDGGTRVERKHDIGVDFIFDYDKGERGIGLWEGRVSNRSKVLAVTGQQRVSRHEKQYGWER